MRINPLLISSLLNNALREREPEMSSQDDEAPNSSVIIEGEFVNVFPEIDIMTLIDMYMQENEQ